ncbi:porin [Sutterella faecalis]|uniref:Porin n=2 Tax=Sutterella TaxID=40544 RepID=A0AAI9SG46_9BURK|nr:MULTISPECIES: porin [Sutterella]KAB7652899.1 porin [Sutterella seckii]QDA54403.1 porin [Sutterella faecalis]
MKQLNIALAAAVAALTFGMASQASAADVQIYGRIDAGLVYEHTDPGVGDATDKFTLDSGVGTASRFGLRGSEDLGNGYQVKFVLENGYKSDTGALSTADTLFDREATLQLVGPFGTISAGRSAILGTDGGSFNLLGGINPFGTGMGNIGNQGIVLAKIDSSRRDNMLTYRSPNLAGFQVTAAYSMGSNDYENKAGSDRYMGIGATYTVGALSTVLLYEGMNEGTIEDLEEGTKHKAKNPEDMWRVTLGGNYNFGFMTVYAAAHCFGNANALSTQGWNGSAMEAKLFGGAEKNFDELEGYSGIVGFDAPLAGGKVLASVGALKAETDELDEKVKATAWFAGLGYQYNLSKSTRLYTGIGYTEGEYKYKGEKVKPESLSTVAGLSYYF